MEHAQDSGPSAGTRESVDFFAPLVAHLGALDGFLGAQVPEFEPQVRPLVEYTLQHRGKRLRPGLVFFAGWTGGAPIDPLVRAAAVVELVHLATLVHDDILDEACLRHNSPTVAARYGRHAAVLLGDALFAHALVLAAQFPTTEVCRVVSMATRQVCSGEICQTFERGNAGLSLGQYFRIIRLKTAELFEASCRLGASLAYPGEPDYAEACAIYGRHLGCAYQIFDDIVDIVGSESGTGKTLGTDFASGKFTLPVLLHLRRLAPEAGGAAGRGGFHPGRLTAEALAPGVRAECREIFDEEIRKALAAIAPFSGHLAHPHLSALAAHIQRHPVLA